MDDPELAALRASRLAELQAKQGASQGQASKNAQQEAMQRQQEMKDSMLSALLTQDARARLGRIAAVKPEKAQQIENMIIRLHQQGQIQPKLDEDALVRLLDRISDAASKQTIKINRRRMADSDDDDDEWS